MRNLIIALALILASSPAMAATLVVDSGRVTVSRGGGFLPVRSGGTVSAGDRVLVGRNGSATIVYSPNCRVRVGSGEIATVLATEPCNGGIVPLDYLVGGAVVAAGIGGAIILGHSP